MKTNQIVLCFILFYSLLSGTLLFVVSQNVQSVERDIRTVDKFVDNEKESLRVLKAEWHYLNRPDRLEEMIMGAQEPLDVTKIKRIDEVIFVPENELKYVRAPLPQMKPLLGVSPSFDKGLNKNFGSLLNDLEVSHGE